ncbi:MAG: hypothetical protein D6780_07205 [Candidatus Dadabacteria bacterium]|nr:MAG: hypothetical protein D6780_07205 [Candidatus Dadabacteria bacterium]
MSRITETQIIRSLLVNLARQRGFVDKFSNEISTGLKAVKPGDTKNAGTIAQFQATLQKVDNFKQRIANVIGLLNIQDEVLSQTNDLLVRAKEIAEQGANETLSTDERSFLAEEVFALRDQLINLANTKYQGRYIFSGLADDQPAYSQTTSFTNPSSGDASIRYAYTTADGSTSTRSVKVTDDISVTVNTPGSTIFNNALYALERLGRALAGYKTEPSSGAPDGSGDPYTFPDEFSTQTQDIQNALDLLETARKDDVMTERTDLGGRIARLHAAESLLDLTSASAKEVASNLQEADITEAASNLTQAQTALDASMAITFRILNQSILNFL